MRLVNRGILALGLTVAIQLLFGTTGCSESMASIASQADGSNRVAWKATEIRSPLESSALAADSTFVFACTSNWSIAAARLTNGSVAWAAQADETCENCGAPWGLSLCSGNVVFGSYFALCGVSPLGGALRWRWVPSNSGGVSSGYPVCADSTVYVGTTGQMPVCH
jgi:hypothetical protein